MKLEGSCACGAVRFSLESKHPYPYMHCYCCQCRKTGGGGGYAINISGDTSTLKVEGEKHVKTYRATIQNPEDEKPWKSKHERRFCGECGSHLYAWHPEWPDLVHPMASAIDTPLPVPPERQHIMLDFIAPWVKPVVGPDDKTFERYPKEWISHWHQRLGLET